MPKSCLAPLKDYHKVLYPVYQNDFSLLMKYKLLNKTPQSLIRYMDVSETLANRIQNNLNDFFNYKQFCELLKTRELTQTRINRALLHIMLGLKKNNVREYMENGGHFYAKLLGFRKDRQDLLSIIAKKSIGKPITPPPLFIKSSYQSASPSQYTAFGQCVLLQRAISGAFLAKVKSSAYEDLCVRALPNALVAVSD